MSLVDIMIDEGFAFIHIMNFIVKCLCNNSTIVILILLIAKANMETVKTITMRNFESVRRRN